MNTKKHQLTGTKIYNVWKGIKARCLNPKNRFYKDYGGRGILICDEWKNDAKAFCDWSMSHGYEEGLTIDRIDNNGNYSPDNCRWVSMKEQCQNRRSNHLICFNNEIRNLKEWSEILNIPYNTLQVRLNQYKWSIEKALGTPVRKYRIFVKGDTE